MALFKRYVFTFLAVLGATTVGLLLRVVLSPINLALLYLPIIILSAALWGLGPSLFASVLSVLIVDAIFVPPYGLISITSPQDFITYSAFLVAAIVTAQLSGMAREQLDLARTRELQTAALYALSQKIAFQNNRTEILDAALYAMTSFFGTEALVFLPNAEGQLQPFRNAQVLARERTMAQWVYAQTQAAQVARSGSALFLPMHTAQGNFGVLALRNRARGNHLAVEDEHALAAFAAQIAHALEHVQLEEKVQNAHLHEASERFNEALLASLSHDLRTPLAAIVGSSTTLLDPATNLDVDARNELALTIQTEATRLSRFVSNLIEMTRLEAGGLKPHVGWNSISEVVEAALTHVNLQAHETEVYIPPDLPLVSFDFVLLEEVLVNLIENAVKYSEATAPIEISARLDDIVLQVSVADHGAGIPKQDLTRVFERNYRVQRDRNLPGSGLGLMICKGIVEAHGGTIWAESNGSRGTRVTFTLPAAERITVE